MGGGAVCPSVHCTIHQRHDDSSHPTYLGFLPRQISIATNDAPDVAAAVVVAAAQVTPIPLS